MAIFILSWINPAVCNWSSWKHLLLIQVCFPTQLWICSGLSKHQVLHIERYRIFIAVYMDIITIYLLTLLRNCIHIKIETPPFEYLERGLVLYGHTLTVHRNQGINSGAKLIPRGQKIRNIQYHTLKFSNDLLYCLLM